MFLMVYWWPEYKNKKVAIRVSLIFPLIVFIAYIGLFATGKVDNYINSDKYLLENLKITTANKETPLYYWESKNYSGQFYSNGKAQILKTFNELDSVLSSNKKIFFVISTKRVVDIPKKYKDQLILTQSNYKTSIFVSKQKP